MIFVVVFTTTHLHHSNGEHCSPCPVFAVHVLALIDASTNIFKLSAVDVIHGRHGLKITSAAARKCGPKNHDTAIPIAAVLVMRVQPPQCTGWRDKNAIINVPKLCNRLVYVSLPLQVRLFVDYICIVCEAVCNFD